MQKNRFNWFNAALHTSWYLLLINSHQLLSASAATASGRGRTEFELLTILEIPLEGVTKLFSGLRMERPWKATKGPNHWKWLCTLSHVIIIIIFAKACRHLGITQSRVPGISSSSRISHIFAWPKPPLKSASMRHPRHTRHLFFW